MSRGLVAGIAYVAVVFALAFLLGIVRVTVTAPRIGELAATLLEVPIVLAASWVACGWAVRRFAVPGDLASRLTMGGVAFGLLMIAEFAVSALLSGRGLAAYLGAFHEPAKLIGLGAQLLFGLMPLLRRQAAPSASSA